MLAVMPGVTARSELHRLKVETDNAAGDVKAGLALQAQRLKCVGVLRTAPHQIAAATQAERDVAAHAAIVSGEIATTDLPGWRVHRRNRALA